MGAPAAEARVIAVTSTQPIPSFDRQASLSDSVHNATRPIENFLSFGSTTSFRLLVLGAILLIVYLCIVIFLCCLCQYRMFEAEMASIRDPQGARLAGDDEEQGRREVEKLLRKRRALGLDETGRARWKKKRRRGAAKSISSQSSSSADELMQHSDPEADENSRRSLRM